MKKNCPYAERKCVSVLFEFVMCCPVQCKSMQGMLRGSLLNTGTRPDLSTTERNHERR